MSQPQISQLMLLRSFLTVGSSYVLGFITFLSIMFGLGYAFFPEFVEVMSLEAWARDEVMDNNPEKAIPSLMFWLTVGLTSLAFMCIGWLVIKTSPFAPFSHAVFLSVLMFISFLQIAIGDPPAKKAMTIVYLIAFPLSILIGANWSHQKMMQDEKAR